MTGDIVYSTGRGRMCPGCGHPVKKCDCRKQSVVVPGDGIIRVGRQTKGRKGKGVSVITGLTCDGEERTALIKKLKQVCGAGGSDKGGVVEIQGDCRDQIVAFLAKQGLKVKKSGG